MMRDSVKKPAIPAVGYDYQLFYGLKLICDWMSSPGQYQRFRFEVDDQDIAPTSLDDIIAERSDGKYDYWQIKYTPSPYKLANALSWSWLFEKSGKTDKSRSLIKKWYDSLKAIYKNTLASVNLVTNRKPDRDILSNLSDDGYLRFDTAPQDIQQKLVEEIGSKPEVMWLLNSLHVQHSCKGFRNLDNAITSALRRLEVSEHAIEKLKNQSRYWSRFKDDPPPDGWIRRKTLKELFVSPSPRLISEKFEISNDYQVPGVDFHNNILNEILHGTKKILVLTGPPGRGKSSYLSYLCNEMGSQDIPYIRHHYFLSFENHEQDRISAYIVKNALVNQIKNKHDSSGDSALFGDPNLYKIIENCSRQYKEQGKKFVVIIDGLDHVCRDHDRGIQQLNDLFQDLIPVPDNMLLLIGTQPVSNDKLPKCLVLECPRKTWIKVPPMSEKSVKDYLQLQINKDKLIVHTWGNGSNDLPDSATELCKRTKGHPLHVIYATEYLINNKIPLTSRNVEQIPGELNDSTKKYYESLWLDLTSFQYDLLYLISRFNFIWPHPALINRNLFPEMKEKDKQYVLHLLHNSEVGVTIFHSSLSDFVLSKYENKKEKQNNDEILKRVTKWLQDEAPVHIKDMWLWRIQAQAGHTKALINGVTRDWLITRLNEGYMIKDIEAVIYDATRASFNEKQYANSYKLNHLNFRLTSGLKYELEDPTRLLMCSWRLASNDNIIKDIVARKSYLLQEELAALAIVCFQKKNKECAHDICEYIIKRYCIDRIQPDTQHFRMSSPQWYWTGYAVGFVAWQAVNRNLLQAIGGEDKWDFWDGFLKGVIGTNDLHALKELHQLPLNPMDKKTIENAIVRLAIIEGAQIGQWEGLYSVSGNPLIQSSLYLENGAVQAKEDFAILQPKSLEGRNRDEFYFYVHDLFFNCVLAKLIDENKPYQYMPLKPQGEFKAHFHENMNRLTEIARTVASRWLQKQEVSFSDFYELLNELNHPNWEKNFEFEGYGFLPDALMKIAIDCHLLSAEVTGRKVDINKNMLEDIVSSRWFHIDSFREFYAKQSVCLLNEEAVIWLLEHITKKNFLGKYNKNEYSSIKLELCEITLLHDLDGKAKLFYHEIWELALKYGYHKDLTICSLVDAIEYLDDVNPAESMKLINAITPQIHHIRKYTDGDETRHIEYSVNDLLRKISLPHLAQKYHDHIDEGQWYLAEEVIVSRFSDDLSSPILRYIAKTGLAKLAIAPLEKCANDGSPDGKELYQIVCVHNGISSQDLSVDERITDNFDTDYDHKKDIPPEVFEYTPNDLNLFLEFLNNYMPYEASELFEKWYSYWVTKEKENEIFEAISKCDLDSSFRHVDIRKLLDSLFMISLNKDGKTKAFKYIVAAHRKNWGWEDYANLDGNSESRLKLVACHYPKRIDEFVRETCFNSFDKGKRIVPGKRLVSFFLKAKMEDEAIRLLWKMVESLQEDTSMFSLSQPNWGKVQEQQSDQNLRADIRLLIGRLRWPALPVKWWSIQALADLLADNNFRSLVEKEISLAIAESKLETESLEILQSCWLATKISDYVPSCQVMKSLRLPSVASSLLIADWLGYYPSINSFDYQLCEVPLWYESDFAYTADKYRLHTCVIILQNLERYFHIPLVNQLKFEWDQYAKRYPEQLPLEDLGLLGSEHGDEGIGSFITRGQQRLQSAYLRVLTLAYEGQKIPESIITSRALMVRPLNPTLARLRPRCPEWFFPFIGEFEEGEATAITKYLLNIQRNIQIENHHDSLLYLSFQQKLQASNDIIELDIYRCAQWEDSEVVPSELIDKIDNFCQVTATNDVGNNHFSEESILQVEDIASIRNINSSSAAVAGRWRSPSSDHFHSDMWARGLFAPISTVDGRIVTIRPANDGLEMYLNNDLLSKSAYWNIDWCATRLKQTRGPHCAVALTGDERQLNNLWQEPPIKYFFLWRCSIIKSENSNSHSKEEFVGYCPCS